MMPVRKLPIPDRAYLLSLFSYDPNTGSLVRRKNGKNACQAGLYWRVRIDGVLYVAHRIIWRMAHDGDMPDELDHINGDKKDNRLCNLREATVSENMRNWKLRSNNKSGLKGVSYKTRCRKWVAQIQVNKKNRHLGLFNDPYEAYEVYLSAAAELHGEFANDGWGPLRATP